MAFKCPFSVPVKAPDNPGGVAKELRRRCIVRKKIVVSPHKYEICNNRIGDSHNDEAIQAFIKNEVELFHVVTSSESQHPPGFG